MKFKTIFLLFNLVVLFAFLFVALVPFIMLGSEFSQLFWSQNWVLVLLFILFIGLLDGYFILNWKLFVYLEQENWPSLMSYLEERIYQKGQFNLRLSSLYVNTCLSVSNLDKVRRLELEIREKKPELLKHMALSLGIPYLINKDNQAAEAYFSEMLNLDGNKQRGWMHWCLAFTLISQRKTDEALEPLLELIDQDKRDPILSLLGLYLLDSLRSQVPSEKQEKITQETLSLKAHIGGQSSWEKALSKSREKNLLPVLLGTLIQEARQWILKVEA